MAGVQAREVRHNSKVGELDGEVRGLQQSQVAMQATLDAGLEASQLREQVCTTTPATPPVFGLVQTSLTMQALASHYYILVTFRPGTPCHALNLNKRSRHVLQPSLSY